MKKDLIFHFCWLNHELHFLYQLRGKVGRFLEQNLPTLSPIYFISILIYSHKTRYVCIFMFIEERLLKTQKPFPKFWLSHTISFRLYKSFLRVGTPEY